MVAQMSEISGRAEISKVGAWAVGADIVILVNL